MILEFIDSCLLSLFVRIGNRWFDNVAFSCEPKTQRVRHMIFAQDANWLKRIISIIEKAEVRK
jgi:hypothetical protein